MSKFTQGPWFRDQYGHVYGWEPTEHGKRSVLLIDNRHSSATSADKNLIAAARELLDALQGLVALLPDPELDADEVQREYVLVAKAAIAKAGAA
jgi:hypothetical protein